MKAVWSKPRLSSREARCNDIAMASSEVRIRRQGQQRRSFEDNSVVIIFQHNIDYLVLLMVSIICFQECAAATLMRLLWPGRRDCELAAINIVLKHWTFKIVLLLCSPVSGPCWPWMPCRAGIHPTTDREPSMPQGLTMPSVHGVRTHPASRGSRASGATAASAGPAPQTMSVAHPVYLRRRHR